MKNVSYFVVLGFIFIVFIYSLIKKINTYDSFITGIKKGIKSGISLLPFIMGMYISTQLFISSNFIEELLTVSKIPSDFIIQGVFKPISSQASLSLYLSIINDYGINSKEVKASSILQGGSESFIYVLGFYLSYAGIKKNRHIYIIALISYILFYFLCLFALLFIF